MKLKTALVGATGALLIATPFASVQAFSPDRQTYACNSAGQCIGADHVQFNSFTNNPAYGDERDFLTVRDAASSTNSYSNSIQVADGKQYVVRFYVHNNAQQDLAGTPSKYIAKDTAVRVSLPAQVSGNASATGYISASNANPGVVSDDIMLTSTGKVTLQYVPGSAKILTNGQNNVTLSDSIVGSGATVGYSALDGNWPGCFNYSGWVTLTVKATAVPTPPVTPPTPPVTPPTTPAALPNTGPGSVVGLFVGISAVAALFHFVWNRRFASQG